MKKQVLHKGGDAIEVMELLKVRWWRLQLLSKAKD